MKAETWLDLFRLKRKIFDSNVDFDVQCLLLRRVRFKLY